MIFFIALPSCSGVFLYVCVLIFLYQYEMTTFRRSLLLLVSLLVSVTFTAQGFIHPGVLHKASDLARMRQKVAEKAEPWYTAWNNLRNSPEAQLGWNPRAVEVVIRGGAGDNIGLMYRDVAAAYAHALIYNITGSTAHGDKAAQILNAWASINKSVSGNADRYLAAGLNGYQFANAAELMREYPAFKLEQFKEYMMNVFYYPMNERFILGNNWGAPHNDACATNYRLNWDACNMNAMMAISILCDYRDGFEKALNYAKSGSGTGNINRAVNYIHSPVWGQWEESGRDQGHTMGGLMLYGVFCEIAWNQGVDFYGYDDSRYRKGAEYVARYNIMENGQGKYNDLPYTSYTRLMGSNCTAYTEPQLSSAVRGKYGSGWEMIYNHYARRRNEGEKVQSMYEILQQQPSIHVPALSAHPDTYDHPAVATLTFRTDSGTAVLPWEAMDVMPRTIVKQAHYGTTSLSDDVIRINASGSGITGQADHFHFVYQRLIDEGVFVTRIDSLEATNAASLAGIMFRENASQESPFVMLSINASNELVVSKRENKGETVTVIQEKTTTGSFPLWLKMTRVENNFQAYTSNDGIEWTESGSVELALSRDLLVGFAATSSDKDMTTTAVFSNTELTQVNIKPVITMTSPVAGEIEYIAPANITVKVGSFDIDGEIEKVELYLNTSLVYTLKTSTIDYQLKNLSAGTYRLEAKAYDLLGAVQSTGIIEVEVKEPTSQLPWYPFDESSAATVSADANEYKLDAELFGGAGFDAGKYGNALQLDGINDYALLPVGFLNKLSNFSVSCWVNPDELSVWSRIFDFGSGTNNYMMLTPNNGSAMVFEMNVKGVVQNVTTTRRPATGGWTFLVLTLGNNTLTLYVNGVSTAKNTNFTLRPYELGAITQNYIGKSQFSADPYLKGKIDDLRFFNYALTYPEIVRLLTGATAVVNTESLPLLAYPNPARDWLTLRKSTTGELAIYDTAGRQVLNSTLTKYGEETIDIRGLKPGFYLLSMTGVDGGRYQQKLMIN